MDLCKDSRVPPELAGKLNCAVLSYATVMRLAVAAQPSPAGCTLPPPVAPAACRRRLRPTPPLPSPPCSNLPTAAKYEAEAGNFWDLFYRRNLTRFFKDRHWFAREFPQLLGARTVLEVGGAGSVGGVGGQILQLSCLAVILAMYLHH